MRRVNIDGRSVEVMAIILGRLHMKHTVPGERPITLGAENVSPRDVIRSECGHDIHRFVAKDSSQFWCSKVCEHNVVFARHASDDDIIAAQEVLRDRA